jgi:antitoxin component YwqK of YwqJK toxin-antitoxin module
MRASDPLIHKMVIIKYILVSLLLGMVLSATAQEFANPDINQVDDRGWKQGVWKAYDVNGQLKFEGRFVDNLPVGTFKFYYPDGKLKAVSEMLDGGKRSMSKVYHPNGKLMATGNYLNKQKDSTWLYYSDFDGVLLSAEYYVNGLLDSVVYNYYPGGALAEDIPYEQGVKHGPWRQYFTDGKIKLKATYVDGKLEGLMLVYHTNGVHQISGMYKNNLKDGLWIYYDEKGRITSKEIFREGRLIKTEKPE